MVNRNSHLLVDDQYGRSGGIVWAQSHSKNDCNEKDLSNRHREQSMKTYPGIPRECIEYMHLVAHFGPICTRKQ